MLLLLREWRRAKERERGKKSITYLIAFVASEGKKRRKMEANKKIKDSAERQEKRRESNNAHFQGPAVHSAFAWQSNG